MFNRSSSLKCIVFSVILIIILILLKLNQDVIIYEIKPLENDKTIFSSTQLLDLPIKFKFLFKPKDTFCDTETKLIIFVHSKLDHFDERNEIRLTWGEHKLQHQFNYRLVFLIGLSEIKNNRLENNLENEFKLNGDLVRGNFIDTYHNLTYKHIMGYKYILMDKYCSKVNLIMKSDDDAFINIFEILNLLNLLEIKNLRSYELNENYEIRSLNLFNSESNLINNNLNIINQKQLIQNLIKNNEKFIACSLFPNGTTTRRTGKWSLTKQQYDLDYLPSYCSGITYFLNKPALHQIYLSIHNNPMKKILFIDDLFITGIIIQNIQNDLNKINYNLQHQQTEFKSNSKLDNDYSNRSIKKSKKIRILNWSEFYNYSWKEFIKALVKKDNFNSLYFINDLDRMPNRNKLVKIAWKKIKNYYQIF